MTKKVSYFCSNKGKVPGLSHSNIVYEITCPGCMKMYIGKTDKCIYKCLTEHSTQLNTSAMAQHLTECEHAQFLANLHSQYDQLKNLPSLLNSPNSIKTLIFNPLAHSMMQEH